MSISAISGWNTRSLSRAPAASSDVSTSWPARVSSICNPSRASALSSTISRRRRRPRRLGLGARDDRRQPHRELASVAGSPAGDRYRPAVEPHQLLHQREPQAETAARAIERLRLLHEQVEHAGAELAADPFAGVAHVEHGVAAGALGRHADLAPLRG